MNIESQIVLNRIKLRPFQEELFRALENKGYKKALCLWPRRCLSGNSLILMADGSEKPLKDIKVGDRVKSWSGKSFSRGSGIFISFNPESIEDDIVKNVWKTEKKETIKIQMAFKKIITTSKDHLFFTRASSKEKEFEDVVFKWTKAGDMKEENWPVVFDSKSNNWETGYFKVYESEPEELYDMETTTHHNFIANGYLVHNSGKDFAMWNYCIREAMRKVMVIYYIFPTYSQARRAIWDSITSDSVRFIDMIPKDLIARRNEQEMKITFINGSILQLCGSTDYDRLRGTNCRLAIFSEYGYQDPTAYQVIRPILLANNGTVCFISTVNGKNHLWSLYNVAKETPDWYCTKLSVEDTKHIDIEDIEREIASGEISRELARQEYWNDFETGSEGAYYAKYLDKMRLNNQIGQVPWEPSFKVHTSWDLGMRDSTAIIFFQVIGQIVRIIDYFEGTDKGLEDYAAILQSKPYQYGNHFAPHDIAVRELGTGLSRLEKARQLGISFQMAPNLSIADGIEAVRTSLAKIWIDEGKCKRVVDTLLNYRKEWDNKLKIYKDKPLHCQYSNCADSLRYLCLSLPKTRDGMSAEDLRRIQHEAIYGSASFGPSPFNNNKPYY